MQEPQASGWERGARKGPRPLRVLAFLVIVILVSVVGLFVWLFNSPGFRVAREVYEAAPDIVTNTNYSTVDGFETLWISVARDVTRDEALDLQCRIVIPKLIREHLAPRIVIHHPDDDFTLDGAACPSS